MQSNGLSRVFSNTTVQKHQFFGAQLSSQSKLNKVGKTTRSFRYDLNQIPYDYTVEVTNRFKGLDLRDRVPKELWTEARDIGQEVVIKAIPKEKKLQKGKMVV